MGPYNPIFQGGYSKPNSYGTSVGIKPKLRHWPTRSKYQSKWLWMVIQIFEPLEHLSINHFRKVFLRKDKKIINILTAFLFHIKVVSKFFLNRLLTIALKIPVNKIQNLKSLLKLGEAKLSHAIV